MTEMNFPNYNLTNQAYKDLAAHDEERRASREARKEERQGIIDDIENIAGEVEIQGNLVKVKDKFLTGDEFMQIADLIFELETL